MMLNPNQTCRRCGQQAAQHPYKTETAPQPHPTTPEPGAAPAPAPLANTTNTTSPLTTAVTTTAPTASTTTTTTDSSTTETESLLNAGPTVRWFVRAMWKGEEIVPVVQENPLTRTLYEQLAQKAESPGANGDWMTIFRKTVGPGAANIAARMTCELGPALHTFTFHVGNTAPLTEEEVVNFLAELGVALLKRHLHVIRDEIIQRRMHREHMLPQAHPITAREHTIAKILDQERYVGLREASLPLRMPTSWEVPSWWGALWVLLTPQLRMRYWEDAARAVVGNIMAAWTKPSMGMYLPRPEWELRYREHQPAAVANAVAYGATATRPWYATYNPGPAAHPAGPPSGTTPPTAQMTATAATSQAGQPFRGNHGRGPGGNRGRGRGRRGGRVSRWQPSE